MINFTGKWIRFDELTAAQYPIYKNRKTKTFRVVNKETNFVVGTVSWYPAFRQYSFYPSENTVFEQKCLSDISTYLKLLMDEHKQNKLNPVL